MPNNEKNTSFIATLYFFSNLGGACLSNIFSILICQSLKRTYINKNIYIKKLNNKIKLFRINSTTDQQECIQFPLANKCDIYSLN